MDKKRVRQKVTRDTLPLGTELIGRTKGTDVHAEIIEDPSAKSVMRICFKSNIYRSLSGAARAATGCSTNGWKFWRVSR